MPSARFLALALALAACASKPTPRPSDASGLTLGERSLPPREKLPAAAREMLTMRMDRHGDRMNLLMESVVLLNYEVAQVLADELAAEPKLGRPAPGEQGTLNALLPAAFFTHQDHLVERARTLAQAAAAHDDIKLMAAFTELAGTCVACHSAYLYEDEDLPVDDESWRRHEPESSGASKGEASAELAGRAHTR